MIQVSKYLGNTPYHRHCITALKCEQGGYGVCIGIFSQTGAINIQHRCQIDPTRAYCTVCMCLSAGVRLCYVLCTL